MTDVVGTFLEGAVRTATPLGFAALGELIVERSGAINISLEGSIICGALGGLIASGYYGTWFAFVIAGLCGVMMAFLFAVFVTSLRADQIITGVAISLLALGVTGTVYRQWFGPSGVGLTIPTMKPLVIPIIGFIPIVGRAFFSQPPITYVLYGLVPAMGWWLFRTHAGLALRSVGENPEAAIAAGVATLRLQFGAILVGGFLGGVAGGVLVIAQAGTFAEGMSAGRGFIAIAIVALGRWHPAGIALAAFLFGAASAIQYLFQTMGWNIPYQLFLALPYLLTLLGLAGITGRSRAPAHLGKPIPLI